MKYEEAMFPREWEAKEPEIQVVGVSESIDTAAGAEAGVGVGVGVEALTPTPSDAALGALLEEAAADEDDAERRVQRLGSQLARLDALNVAGMLAAATESGGAGATLAARLDAGLHGGAALQARVRRSAALAQGAPDAVHARSGAARAEANARALLAHLDDLYRWLDAPPLRDLDSLPEVSLGGAEGRARALAAALALQTALRAERTAPPHLRRLAAVRERLRRLARAKDQLAGALARHLNNALIHLGNEAAHEPRPSRHHADLAPYAPFMRWLKDMDEKAFDALAKVYASTWSRVYERTVRAACESARAALAPAPGAAAAAADGAGAGQGPPGGCDAPLDRVLELVETLCNAEQDFCTQFFCLDLDVKAEGSEADGEGEGEGEGEAEGEREREREREREGARRVAGETRRLMGELFPNLEADLVALVAHFERQDPYGAMRALACVGRRVLSAGEAGAGAGAVERRWARAALAGAAVAAKRGADRAVAERVAALGEGVKQAARRHKCGVFPFIPELEALSGACEGIFPAGGRRADLDRWYLALATAIMHAIHHADHPRTPRHVVHMENYHRLHGVVSSLRVPQLEGVRRECRARYADALKAYVTHYFGRPLEKLTQFFEGVSEAVGMGVREEEVCYRAAFSKHELRRVLALYPAAEVRRALHRLYRTVEKHLSEEGGLLQVVWRHMQEEFIAQHVQLQARIAACYPAAGLHLPLTTQDILEAFSDIAREH